MKFKIVSFLLRLNVKIGKKLAFYHAKYRSDKDVNKVVKQQKFDLTGMKERLKNVMLHDQSIIDKRWAECENCEFLMKPQNQCSKCMCFMKVKTRVATARCPVGKWEKEYNFLEGRKNGIIASK